MEESLLEVKGLKKAYLLHGSRRGLFGKKEEMYAVDDMTFQIRKGETYGLVGESGCGKSTTGRAIVGLTKPDAGSIFYQGKDLCKLSEKEFRPLRKDLQMVFQNTLSALNPRQRIGSILEEILLVHGEKDAAVRKERAVKVLRQVGLSEEHYFRYPHELSGGQVQRLGIAGALLIQPKLIVCDEPVSALDVSIQAQILNMLVEIQKMSGISLLFISHDIGVIRFISDRIGVMYLGTLVEEADTENLFEKPMHPYTKALLASAPDPYVVRGKRNILRGEQPVRTGEMKGCAFCGRCLYAEEICKEKIPEMRSVQKGHRVACHLAERKVDAAQCREKEDIEIIGKSLRRG